MRLRADREPRREAAVAVTTYTSFLQLAKGCRAVCAKLLNAGTIAFGNGMEKIRPQGLLPPLRLDSTDLTGSCSRAVPTPRRQHRRGLRAQIGHRRFPASSLRSRGMNWLAYRGLAIKPLIRRAGGRIILCYARGDQAGPVGEYLAIAWGSKSGAGSSGRWFHSGSANWMNGTGRSSARKLGRIAFRETEARGVLVDIGKEVGIDRDRYPHTNGSSSALLPMRRLSRSSMPMIPRDPTRSAGPRVASISGFGSGTLSRRATIRMFVIDVVDLIIAEVRRQRLENRDDHAQVGFVDLQPLHEHPVGCQITGDLPVELVREQGGDSADPRVRWLRNDDVELLSGCCEERLGIVDDDPGSACPRTAVTLVADMPASPRPP